MKKTLLFLSILLSFSVNAQMFVPNNGTAGQVLKFDDKYNASWIDTIQIQAPLTQSGASVGIDTTTTSGVSTKYDNSLKSNTLTFNAPLSEAGDVVSVDTLTDNGVTTKFYVDSLVSTSGAVVDVLGISNAVGQYTYYSTYTLAMAGAVAGNTIEQFSDILEVGVVTITLKDGVNINGNNLRYEITTGSIAFSIATSTNYDGSILNLHVISAGGSALSYGNASTGTIRLSGSTFTSNAQCLYTNVTSTVKTYYGHFDGSIGINNGSPDTEFYYCTGVSIWGTGGKFFFCKALLGGIRANAGSYWYQCHGDGGVGNVGIYNLGGNTYMCTATSKTYIAYYASGAGTSTNDLSRSISYWALQHDGTTQVVNHTSISDSNYGAYVGKEVTGLTAISTSSVALRTVTATMYIHGGLLWSKYNNAAGYGINGTAAMTAGGLINVEIRCSNASADYIYNGGTAAVFDQAGNVFTGGQTPNVNITNGIIATEDNQGNITY